MKGGGDIIVWEAVLLKKCRDVDVRDVGVGCTSSSILMIKFSNFCSFLSASLSSRSLIFSAFSFVTFVEKPNLKTDDMRLLCMTFVFFLFVDGDAVLPDLVGSEFVSFKLLRLGLGFLKLYWSLPPKSS